MSEYSRQLPELESKELGLYSRYSP